MPKERYFESDDGYVDLYNENGNNILIAHSEKGKYSKNSLKAIKEIIDKKSPLLVRVEKQYQLLLKFINKYCVTEYLKNDVYIIHGRKA